CVLASAVEGEGLGFRTEVLADATGAIHLANAAGSADAETVHTTLMTLLNSNWAAVAATSDWAGAVDSGVALAGRDPGGAVGCGVALAGSDLGASAVSGAQLATA